MQSLLRSPEILGGFRPVVSPGKFVDTVILQQLEAAL